MVLTMKNLKKYFYSSLKDPTFRGGLEKPIYRGELPKRGGGGLGQFVDLKGAWQERGGWCF